jgi:GNAT superfamily N-acetyltransferase
MAGEHELSKVEPLGKQHNLDEFDCEKHESLNTWLKKYARANQASDTSKTYVVHRNNVVVAYYAIAAGSVRKHDASARVAKGGQPDPIPISLLARLAVDKHEQGRGLGKALLKDALLRIEQAADIIGIRAILVHAIDADAANFYKNFDFEESPVNELHLMLLMKDLRATLNRV